MLKNSRKLKVVFICTLGAWLFVSSMGAIRLHAQAATATVLGIVKDASGAVVPGVKVDVKNLGTGVSQSAVTDPQGRYRVPDLPVGRYEVHASMTGFQTAARTGMTLTVGSETVVDFELQVGQQEQVVTVQGEVSQVETTNATIATLVGQQQMHELPLNGRNFEQLIVLAPGVQQITAFLSTSFQGRAPQYSIAGGRPTGQALLLDDESLQNFWNKGMGSMTGSSLGVEAIGEFQTLTNTYSAQFGGNGGVVNAVSKSGTNSFHGSAFEFLRNNDLDARNTFASKVQPLRRNQFGGSLGGPIKKDKAFFFGNYEGIRQTLGEVAVATVPACNLPGVCTPTTTNPAAAQAIRNTLAIYPLPDPGTASLLTGAGTSVQVANQPISENYVLARVDYVFSEKDTLFGRYISDKANMIEPFAGGSNFGNGAVPFWPEHDASHYQFLTIEERRMVSPTLVNVAHVSFSRPVSTAFTPPVFPALQVFFPNLGYQDGKVLMSGFSGLGSSSAPPFNLTQNRYTAANDMAWSHGAHTMRFGLNFSRLQTNTYEEPGQNSTWNFPGLSALLAGTPGTLAWTPTGPQIYPHRDYRHVEFMPYVQEDWKITPKLTLNLGLRWEFVSNPIEKHHQLWAIDNYATAGISSGSVGGLWPLWTNNDHLMKSNPAWKNFAPRVGFAYDPFADHKTAIRGGFGVFYDLIMPPNYAPDYWASPPFIRYQAGTQVPGSTVPLFPSIPTTAAVVKPTGANGFDWNNDKTPYMLQYNVNVQRELASGTTLSVGYVGSRGVHLLTLRQANPNVMTVDSAGVAHFGTVVAGNVVDNPRMNPNLGSFQEMIPTSTSTYNSLQTALNHRFEHNLQAQVSYTWSRCIDNGSYGLGSFQSNAPGSWTNPYNQSIDRGPCAHDINHVLSINGLYALPFHRNKLVEGWQLSGILRWSTGIPFTIYNGIDVSGLAATSNTNGEERPNAVAGCDPSAVTAAQASAHVWYNTACYSLPALTTLGNLGRGTGRAPRLSNVDFALLKDTRIARISEAFNVQFRAEFFNIFNHPNYDIPNGQLWSALRNGTPTPNLLAGKISNIIAPPRQIQFALKLIF